MSDEKETYGSELEKAYFSMTFDYMNIYQVDLSSAV